MCEDSYKVHLPASFLPEEDYGFLLLNLQLPPAASLERTDQVSRKIESILKQTEGIQYYTTVDGFSLLNRISKAMITDDRPRFVF